MKKNKIVIVALLSLFLTACISDKGNYLYNEKVEEFQVTFPNNATYNVVAGEEVELAPILRYSVTDTRPVPKVTYEWLLNEKVVSTDEKFIYKAGDKLETIEGYLKVRVIETGEQYAGKFKIMIESAFKTGYVILSENESGGGELNFIRSLKNTTKIGYDTYDTLIYTKDYAKIYELANGFPMPKNPISITEFCGYGDYSTPASALTLVSENGNSIEHINGENMIRETTLKSEFVDDLLPANFIPKQIIDTPWDGYLIAQNGLMYTKRGSAPDLYYSGRYNAKFTYNDDTKYSDIMTTYNRRSKSVLAIEYDKDGKRNYVGIVCENSAKPKNNGLRVPFVAGSNVELLSDFQDVKYEILAYDYLQNGYDRDYVIAQVLLIKENGKYFFHVMELTYNSPSNIIVNGSVKINLEAITGGKPVLGMKTSKMKDYIMFYDEDKIYIYDWGTKTFSTLFTANKKISAVGFLHRIAGYYDYEDYQAIDPSFAVGYETGEVEIYEIEKPNLKTVGKKVFTTTNKYGKIKQIIYRLGDAGEFYNRV